MEDKIPVESSPAASSPDATAPVAAAAKVDTPPVLAYQTPAPRWLGGVAGGAMLIFSHVLGLIASFIILVALPLVLFVLAYVVLFVVAATTKADPGGPLALPVGFIFVLLVGLAAVFTTTLANILTDTVRRVLRWPYWTPPLAVVVLAFATITLVNFVHDRQPPWLSGGHALLPTAALTALFCVYWLPLTFADVGLRIASWFTKKTWRNYRAAKSHGNADTGITGRSK